MPGFLRALRLLACSFGVKAVVGPSDMLSIKATLDSGSDDTIVPSQLASKLGIDLANAPLGESTAVGGRTFQYPYAEVELRLATNNGDEMFIWNAIVGFSDARKTRGILGCAGMMEYFDVAFFGELHEVILTPNSSFPGKWKLRRSGSE